MMIRSTLQSVLRVSSTSTTSNQRCLTSLTVLQSPSSSFSYCYSTSSFNTTTTEEKKKRNVLPTNLFQKVLLGVGSSLIAMYNPGRTDMVAALGEVSGGCVLPHLKTKMMNDSDGRWLLEHKPRIRIETLPEQLSSLAPDTFGGAYYKFLTDNGFSPDDRAEVRMVEDDDEAYVLQRYREVHDFWHVLADIPPNVPGELAIKWLEMVQTGQPMCALSALVGPLRLPFQQQRQLIQHTAPWAVRCGRNSKFLLNVIYENHWNDNLIELRKKLNFEPYSGPTIIDK
ncbi:coenzyme Q biosynthesis protein [Cavenderia fasciculata]|uniref:Ubiquinone biosynthesis protein COQ4 homolog, mitochondrial n=1 Tax=Cavenderia fasciculata TaxID=261658 RepID=F4PTA0_CACFS|nr:coenzyme Q biosynthesis protein [Cavenderia fasciculata]EGG20836.1 coenzyme Q biosynthesis protein [Cavenderia fasciculata]|eukprot:XP_004358686.1 coenzyme Q biosynthesis protein [Cavenderia fasciculata]